MEFDSDRIAEPSIDQQMDVRTESKLDSPAASPLPAPQANDWPIARGRINDPI
jgi:hypothetical protein